MNKLEFLTELRNRLAGLPEEDIAQSIAFWSEMIDDRTEDGMSEEEAVSAVGTPAEAAAQILGEGSLPKTVKPQKRALRAWEVVLLILGSPLWLLLLIAAFAVVLSLYVSAWSVVIAFWASAISVVICSLPMLAVGVLSIAQTNVGAGLLWIGTAFTALGIGLCLIVLSLYLSRLLCRLTVCLFFRKKPHAANKEERK